MKIHISPENKSHLSDQLQRFQKDLFGKDKRKFGKLRRNNTLKIFKKIIEKSVVVTFLEGETHTWS